jgi:hypothetical protein
MDFNKLFSGRQLHQGGKVVDAAVCPATVLLNSVATKT